MRALTVHPEWAWAIAHAGKWVENRTWFPPDALIGERIAIHGGARIRDLDRAIETARETGLSAHQVGDAGAVVIDGRTTLVWRSAIVATAVLHSVSAEVLGTPWQVPGHLAWILTEVQTLPKPVSCTGRLGLWRLPEDIAARIAQVGA